jgi:CSLREA domain-containing protein
MRLLFCFSLLILGFTLSATAQALILVSTADDELLVDGDCSLREAVESANTNTSFDNCGLGAPGSDSIIIPLIDTLVLNSPITILEAVEISGVRPQDTIISGNGQSQLFEIDLASGAGEVTFEELSLVDGFVNDIDGGGAMNIDCVSLLRIENVHFRNNVSAGTGLANGPGGAIRMLPSGGCNATLQLIDTIFIGNQSLANGGGAVWLSNVSDGFNSVLINRSQFIDNGADTGGGGLFAFDVPNLTLLNSLFEGNGAGLFGPSFEDGGAILLRADNVGPAGALLRNLSLVNNRAGFRGGALFVDGGQTVGFTNGSLIGNFRRNPDAVRPGGHAISVAGDASFTGFFLTLWNSGEGAADEAALDVRGDASASLGHSIVANAWPSTLLCETSNNGTLDSLGYLVDQSSTCAQAPTDQALTDPILIGPIRRASSIADFAMPVMTPAEGSPGVDIGPSTCPGVLGTTTTSDQLGRARPVLDSTRGAADCDAGAIERQPGELAPLLQDRFES